MDKDTLLKKFGKNVKIARIKIDLTQEQFAEKMNISQKYVSSIEGGKENMSLGKILRLAEFLETDIHNLLDFRE